ncbi:unnamed protein product [Leptosia nina]|uniref:Uncharacterized protein n=1 Tax=Leptosia nina TaxID=320188 RepID=A0AAV1JKH0_9NEOP
MHGNRNAMCVRLIMSVVHERRLSERCLNNNSLAVRSGESAAWSRDRNSIGVCGARKGCARRRPTCCYRTQA